MKGMRMRVGSGVWVLALAAVLLGSCRDKKKKTIIFPEYNPPRPLITQIIPSPQGFLGDSVNIVGANFDPVAANNIISFNGAATPAVAVDTDATLLVTTVPVGASSGPLRVSVSGTASNDLPFTVLGGPQIISITPDIGPLGTLVTIDGVNFSPVPEENIILFEWNGVVGIETAALSAAGGQLTCYAPAGAGTGLVVVRVGLLDSNAVIYTYTTPSVTDVIPRSGNVGGSVTITGLNFSTTAADNIIRFNGTLAQTQSALPGTLTTTVPPGAAAGPVTVELGGAVSNGIFFCVWTTAPLPPTVSSMTPATGAVGDPVTIQGSNFAANMTDNEVRFNGIVAQVNTLPATDSIDVLVPAGATTGPVTVRRGPESAASSGDFTVTTPPPPPPMLDVLKPAAALEKGSIVIQGTGFDVNPANNIVTFSGVDAEVLAATDTALLVEVPFTDSGVVTVQVADQVSNGLNFTVQGSPAGLNTFPLFGRQIASPSDSVIFVLDLSGSMAWSFGAYTDRFGTQWGNSIRIQVVQDRLIFAISELPLNFRFNIIGYDSVFSPVCESNYLWQPTTMPASQANKAAAIQWVQSLFPMGGTATTFAVEAALRMDTANRTICLITDGEWNCPPRGVVSDADQLCRMFNANLQQAEIHTFGVVLSSIANPTARLRLTNLLRDIAAVTNGTFTQVEPPLNWP